MGPAETSPRECVEAVPGDGDAARFAGGLKLNRLPPVHGDNCACFSGVILAGVLLPCSSDVAEVEGSCKPSMLPACSVDDVSFNSTSMSTGCVADSRACVQV